MKMAPVIPKARNDDGPRGITGVKRKLKFCDINSFKSAALALRQEASVALFQVVSAPFKAETEDVHPEPSPSEPVNLSTDVNGAPASFCRIGNEPLNLSRSPVQTNYTDVSANQKNSGTEDLPHFSRSNSIDPKSVWHVETDHKHVAATERTVKFEDDSASPTSSDIMERRSFSQSPVEINFTDVVTSPEMDSLEHVPWRSNQFTIEAILKQASSTPKNESFTLQSSLSSVNETTTSEKSSLGFNAISLEKKEIKKDILPSDEDSCRDQRSPHCSCPNCRKKMERTKFSKEDVQILMDSFRMNQYPTALHLETLAKQLGYRPIQIKTWFQNKRASTTGTRQPKSQLRGHVIGYPSTAIVPGPNFYVPLASPYVPYSPDLLAMQQPALPIHMLYPYHTYAPAAVGSNYPPMQGTYFPPLPPRNSEFVPPPPSVSFDPSLSLYHYLGKRFV